MDWRGGRARIGPGWVLGAKAYASTLSRPGSEPTSEQGTRTQMRRLSATLHKVHHSRRKVLQARRGREEEEVKRWIKKDKKVKGCTKRSEYRTRVSEVGEQTNAI